MISYVFYSTVGAPAWPAEDAQNRLTQAQKDLQTANFKVQTLDLHDQRRQQDASSRSKTIWPTFRAATPSDPAMAQLQKSFKDNMLLYGAPDQETRIGAELRIAAHVPARARPGPEPAADRPAAHGKRAHRRRRRSSKQTAAERSKKFEDAANQARQDLEAERAKFQTDLARRAQADGSVAAQMTEKDNRIIELAAQMEEQQKAAASRPTTMAKTSTTRSACSTKFEEQSFETPDAVITTVNQKEAQHVHQRRLGRQPQPAADVQRV